MFEHPKVAKAGMDGGHRPAAVMHAAFVDVDEQAAALTGWNQSYLQLAAGGFRGSMRRIDLGGARLFMEALQTSVYQTGMLEAGVLALGVPLHVSEPGLFCGRPCDQNSLHVFSGPSGFEFRSASKHVMLGFELAPELARGLRQGERPFGEEAGLHAADPLAIEGLRQFMLTLFDAAQATPALLNLPAVRVAMVDTLIEQVSALGASAAALDMPPDGYWRLVQDARELIRANIHQAPTVVELCTRLGVSRRTLQNGFQQVLGVSPLSYLRAARLGAARQVLKSSASVTDAATQLGFWHFGHFAKDYQAMFGELPSQTHRRHHQPC